MSFVRCLSWVSFVLCLIVWITGVSLIAKSPHDACGEHDYSSSTSSFMHLLPLAVFGPLSLAVTALCMILLLVQLCTHEKLQQRVFEEDLIESAASLSASSRFSLLVRTILAFICSTHGALTVLNFSVSMVLLIFSIMSVGTVKSASERRDALTGDEQETCRDALTPAIYMLVVLFLLTVVFFLTACVRWISRAVSMDAHIDGPIIDLRKLARRNTRKFKGGGQKNQGNNIKYSAVAQLGLEDYYDDEDDDNFGQEAHFTNQHFDDDDLFSTDQLGQDVEMSAFSHKTGPYSDYSYSRSVEEEEDLRRLDETVGGGSSFRKSLANQNQKSNSNASTSPPSIRPITKVNPIQPPPSIPVTIVPETDSKDVAQDDEDYDYGDIVVSDDDADHPLDFKFELSEVKTKD